MRKIAKTKRVKTGDEMAKQRLVMAGFLAVLFVILTLMAVLFAIIEGRKSVSLDILVAPKDAVITLNGERYKNGEYRVEPGEYEVSITHEGLEPYYKVVDFADGEEVKMYLYLTGVDGDMSWYLAHSEDDMIVTSIGDYYANKKSQEYSVRSHSSADLSSGMLISTMLSATSLMNLMMTSRMFSPFRTLRRSP